MLRRALEGQQQETTSENTSLLPSTEHGAATTTTTSTSSNHTGNASQPIIIQSGPAKGEGTTAGDYGTSLPATSPSHDESDFPVEEEDDDDDDDSSYEDEDDEDDDDDDDWSYHHDQPPQSRPGIARRAWNGIRGFFVLVANVENLWDSPASCSGEGIPSSFTGHTSTSSPANHANQHHSVPHSQQQHQQQHYQNNQHDHHTYHRDSATIDLHGDLTTNATNPAALRRRSYFVVLFWFFILAGSYAAERSTFKLLVDRAGPFRLFSVEMVTGSHASMLGVWMIAAKCYSARKNSNNNNNSNGQDDTIPLGVPLIDVGYMALLDTIHLLMVFLTGRAVCPTLSVILVQFTLPLSAILTQFVRPDGRCGQLCCQNGDDDDDDEDGEGGGDEADEESHNIRPYHHASGDTVTSVSDNQSTTPSEGMPLPGWGGLSAEHLWGSLILTLAVALALFPSLYTIVDPAFFVYADSVPIKTAYNTLLYVSSCFPAAASQLYKEHVFLKNKQPVNATYLNFLLSLFQFILATVMTPLVFGLQGLGAGEDWTSLYPSSHFSKNFLSGLKCFLGLLPAESAENDFPEVAECRLSMLLVLGHAFSIIAVGCAVDKIINAGATKAMYRGISAGIIVAVLLMYEYDMHIPEFNYGPVIDALNLISLILLVIGAEVYHRVSLSDSTFETVYPVLDLYEYEE